MHKERVKLIKVDLMENGDVYMSEEIKAFAID